MWVFILRLAAKCAVAGGGGGGASKVAAALCTGSEGKQSYLLITFAEITATSERGQRVTSQVPGITPASMRTELRA